MELFGRASLIFLILMIWTRVWAATSFAGFEGFSKQQAIWYLMVTEWIVLSVPYVYIEMESDFRSGEYEYALLRPMHYSLNYLFQAFGMAVANWMVVGFIGMLTAFACVGPVPMFALGGIFFVCSASLLAVLICSIAMVTIGLSAAWGNDASPLGWVWQKSHFVLGGLMLPLAIYPEWLVRIARWTPFPGLLGDIAWSFTVDSFQATQHSIAHLLAWSAAMIFVMFGVEFLAERRRTREL